MMTSAQLVREIVRHQPAELALLLGAGTSKSSGIPLASEMIDEWRVDLFESQAAEADRARSTPKEWLGASRERYPWFEQDTEYSKLFELLYRSPARRQKYIEEKIDGVRPGWGYLYLANIIASARRFTTIFTTNFDDLINQALGTFLRHNAVICNADSEVDQISFLSERAKIIKLHGDYLFADIRNTEAELRELGAKMASKFAELARQRGLVVLGYAGRDQSVMSMIETLLQDRANFPYSVYWALRPGERPSSAVAKLARTHEGRFEQVEVRDFDGFMADLHAALKLELPETIMLPRLTLEGELAGLVDKAAHQPEHALIREHSTRLKSQLGRPGEAELALARRDYKTAIDLVQRHIQKQGPTGPALTVWASALVIQADEEGRDDLLREALVRIRQAVDLEPHALPQRYGLAMVLYRCRMEGDAIKACEALRDLAPNDSGVRRQLVDLYVKSRQYAAAERELTWLRQRQPQSVDVPAQQGMIFFARGYMQQAAAQFREAVGRDPTNAQLHLQLAQALVNIRQFDEAEVAFKRAADLAGDSPMVLVLLAEFYQAVRQRSADAIAVLERAVKIDSQSAELRGKLGELYLNQDRVADAERETVAAVAVQPDDARLLVNLGIIQLRCNRDTEAEASWLRARELNPTLPEPRRWLCLLYAVQDRHVESNAEGSEFARLMPQFSQMLAFQVQQMRTVAIQQRMQGLPFDWAVALHSGMQQAGPMPVSAAEAGSPSGVWSSGSLRKKLNAQWHKFMGR